VAKNIGIISPKLPSPRPDPQNSHSTDNIFWFSEIEAAFAFLITMPLDALIIDEELAQDPRSCTKKYWQMIEQIHPRLQVSFCAIKKSKAKEPPLAPITFFPRLDIMLKNGDLKTVFQPIVEVLEGQAKIIGFECLARLHFKGVLCPPDFLFNYAHEKLELKNCDRICLMQSMALAPKGNDFLTFINVRPQTLVETGFDVWLKGLMKKHSKKPDRIVIEITEQYCVISEIDLKEQCLRLQDLGFRLAIDDFGSGISNLSLMEIIRPSYLKISGRFIKGAHLDEVRQKIVKNVLELANYFSISAIVENVETKNEWLQASALGASLAQGYYFYRPMTASQFEALAAETVK
jgi:EAL domain-containing protein (putative c-di-GMP-specific phosphodiesterase class I)